jgi:geranylgeranyl pyrophosphate synthase
MTDDLLTKKALSIVFRSGKPALLGACQKILASPYDNGQVRDALHFYAKSVMPKILPIFPALITLSCKTVGGNGKKAEAVSVAMMLITASGDIHDDIVDNSAIKFGNQTLLGKYGRDFALLAGDLLLTQGITELQKESRSLSKVQQTAITNLIFEGMVNIVKAESLESLLWKNSEVTPEAFFEVIALKGNVAELHCRIGGIIANADKKTIDHLARYGRMIGVLSTLKEEFVDLSHIEELEHRLKHELPPYPMICALQNNAIKTKISNNKNKTDIPSIVLASTEAAKLTAHFKALGEKELACNPLLKGNNSAVKLAVLLEALAVELQSV